MSDTLHIHQTRGWQIEICEKEFQSHQDAPRVEVIAWQSLDEIETYNFKEVDSAKKQLAPETPILGALPNRVTNALAEHGYTLAV